MMVEKHGQTSWFFLVNQKHAVRKWSLISSLDDSETLPCIIYSISKETEIERLRASYPYEK